MSEGLLTAVVVAAALACPAHMWWMSRRGKRAACCPPQSPLGNEAELRARRREIDAQLAGFDVGQNEPAPVARQISGGPFTS